MYDYSYVNTPFLKCIIYEATGEKQNILPLHSNPSYQTFFFFQTKPKSFLLKCTAHSIITVTMHLTKILFSPCTSSDFEFLISIYVLKCLTPLQNFSWWELTDPQDGEVDLETEVFFGFEVVVYIRRHALCMQLLHLVSGSH